MNALYKLVYKTKQSSSLLDSEGFLLVHVGQHEGDVGGQEVVHLVPQRRLAEELRPPDQVSDGHVEVGVAGRPVRNPGERVGDQNLLEFEVKIIIKLNSF